MCRVTYGCGVWGSLVPLFSPHPKKKSYPGVIMYNLFQIIIIHNFQQVLVREPNSENCLDLIFAAPPCKKVIIVPDTNYITYAI